MNSHPVELYTSVFDYIAINGEDSPYPWNCYCVQGAIGILHEIHSINMEKSIPYGGFNLLKGMFIFESLF